MKTFTLETDAFTAKYDYLWRLSEDRWAWEYARRSNKVRRYAESRAIDARPISVETHDHPPGTFRTGERVFHQKFGYGLIEDIEGNKLSIAFEQAGAKKVIDSFVQPA